MPQDISSGQDTIATADIIAGLKLKLSLRLAVKLKTSTENLQAVSTQFLQA
ncbi:hypothetical protein [Nostoc sp. WHI]|uniref:hypothetical protein n=1 Tax=Nostoc sp. WHI TaxID=2650611 RepID=UPI0018C5BF1C|nr:hypothetical protein [Nostoc sp. WHI]